MRHKYRAFADGKMHYPGDGMYWYFGTEGYWSLNTDRHEIVCDSLESEGAVLMESTGFSAENADDIYEGDIVKFTYWWFDGNECESELTGTIVYSDNLMSFQLKGVRNKEWEKFTGHENDTEYLTAFSELCFDEADFEVIGNVYENQELLEVPK